MEWNWQTKVPSPSIDIVSFRWPTVPFQFPTILVEYSAFGTVDELCEQDIKESPKRIPAIALGQDERLVFINSFECTSSDLPRCAKPLPLARQSSGAGWTTVGFDPAVATVARPKPR